MGPTVVLVMGGFWRYGNLKSNEISAKTLLTMRRVAVLPRSSQFMAPITFTLCRGRGKQRLGTAAACL